MPADARLTLAGAASPQGPIFIFPMQQSGQLLLPPHPPQAMLTDELQALLSLLLWCVGNSREPGIWETPFVGGLQASGHQSTWLSPASSTHRPALAQKGKGLLKDLPESSTPVVSTLHQVLPHTRPTSSLLWSQRPQSLHSSFSARCLR